MIASNHVTGVTRQPITMRQYIDPVCGTGPIRCDFQRMAGNLYYSEETGTVDWRELLAEPR